MWSYGNGMKCKQAPVRKQRESSALGLREFRVVRKRVCGGLLCGFKLGKVVQAGFNVDLGFREQRSGVGLARLALGCSRERDRLGLQKPKAIQPPKATSGKEHTFQNSKNTNSCRFMGEQALKEQHRASAWHLKNAASESLEVPSKNNDVVWEKSGCLSRSSTNQREQIPAEKKKCWARSSTEQQPGSIERGFVTYQQRRAVKLLYPNCLVLWSIWVDTPAAALIAASACPPFPGHAIALLGKTNVKVAEVAGGSRRVPPCL